MEVHHEKPRKKINIRIMYNTLQDIARHLNYSPAYVSTIFSICAGQNFKAYLDYLRVNRAKVSTWTRKPSQIQKTRLPSLRSPE